MNPWTLAVAALAAHRAARAVTADSITDPIRGRLLEWTSRPNLSDRQVARREWLAGNPDQGSEKVGLLVCPHCIGFHLSWITLLVWHKVPVLRPVICVWAVAGAQSMLTSAQARLDAEAHESQAVQKAVEAAGP